MKTTCPHCAVHIDIDPETHAALQGQTHFQCPGCNSLVSVPPQSAASPQPTSPAPATILAQAHRGLNRNLLSLGSAALLVLGGLGFFLASRGGSIFNSEQKITNEIINNRYFQNLIASGATTRRDLESLALVRPFGTSFVGISHGDFAWEQAQDMARRVGAEVLSIGPSADGSRQQLVDLLEAAFGKHLAAAVWVRDGTEPRILDGPDVLPVSGLERQRKVLLHWRKGPKESKEAAIAKWQNARLGMFIHWGPASLTGEELSWSRGKQVPAMQYDELYKRFNPTEFNADQWVAIAKAGGMKYIVLTTKHHDGFCLWDTKHTDYNIMRTPFKRDVVKELADACRRAGIEFGAYYSVSDWHHSSGPNQSATGGRKDSDLNVYDTYLQAQVSELISQYGPLLTVWFDVPHSYGEDRGKPMVDRLRKLQPGLLINNRAYSARGTGRGTGLQKGVGDYLTPEKIIGSFELDQPWETCMPLCEQWAWRPDDRMKSLAECVALVLRTIGGDGNLLLNVGPMSTGKIEPRQAERLKEMGAWLSKHAAAIYGTRGGPWKPAEHLLSTRRDDKIYLHLLHRPAGPITLPALPLSVSSARILNGPLIDVQTRSDILSFLVPEASWDGIATVVEITVKGDSMSIPPL